MIKTSRTTRKRRDGTIVHRLRGWIDGKRTSLGDFETLDDLIEAERRVQERYADHPGALTFGAWASTCLDARETDGKHRTATNDRSRWDRHVAGSKLAGLALRRVTRAHVLELIDDLDRRNAVSTIVVSGEAVHRPTKRRLSRQTKLHVLHLVQRFLALAVEKMKIPAHPAIGIRIPAEATTEEPWTWLTTEEIGRVLALPGAPRGRKRPNPASPFLHPHQRSAITVAIYAGLRAGELWGLRWRDVILDGPRPELVVRHSYRGPTKSGQVRRVPLLEPARVALRTWLRARPGVGDALVWPAEDGGCHASGYDAGWERVLAYAEIDRPVRWHDLRHTCASHLVQGTWTTRHLTLLETAAWLGHEDVETTQRYSHLAPDGLHEVVRGGPQVVPARSANRKNRLRTQQDSNLRPSAPEARGAGLRSRADRSPVVHLGSTERSGGR